MFRKFIPSGLMLSGLLAALLLAPLDSSAQVLCEPFEKQVSVDNGVTWQNADDVTSAPMQTLGGGAIYRFIVTNCFEDKVCENTRITDPDLLIDALVGDGTLQPLEQVIVTKDDQGFGNLDQPDRCDTPGIKTNKATETTETVDSDGTRTYETLMDEAFLYCESPRIKLTKFTNGHDGDNANGVPTPGEGTFMPNNTVAEIPVGGDITWVYRVTNTGTEELIDVVVTDDRLGMITCPKNSLAPSESMDCQATGSAMVLDPAYDFVVPGCGDGRPTYNNTGKVFAFGSPSGRPVEVENPSHYCNPNPPACDLALKKTCEIIQPPESDWASCKGKLQKFTLIWPSNGGTVNISGIANDAPGGVVNPGQKVTFSGPFSSNDVFLNISGAQNGQSNFHVSCSDDDMDGLTSTNDEQQQLPGKAQDCGKFEGNGKDKTGFINTWLLDGLVDAEGKVLNCSPTPTPPTSSCAFQAEDPPSCGTGGRFKPDTLTFQYTGGGCSTQSNSQDSGKTSCSGQINPLEPVTVTPSAGGGPFTVQPGETFTINREGSNTFFTLTNSGGTETDGLHTSCSQPLMVGDVFFSLTLVAQDGIGPGKQVKYRYDVTNTGFTPAGDITVVDDKLGSIGTITSLSPGDTQTLTATTLIEQTTTNVATATAAAACPAPGVQATATVTVLPAPPCTVEQTFYKVEDDKYKVKLTNTGNKVATLDALVLNWPAGATYESIKKVKLDGDIYKRDDSSLLVTSGVPITASDWTEANVAKRQLDPGETRKLEIEFSEDWEKENCPGGNCFSGTASFAEGCEVDLDQ